MKTRSEAGSNAAPERLVVLMLAVVGALGLGYLAWTNASAPGVHPANLVHPGVQGPSAAAVAEDFPDDDLPPGLGHDGQQFYAVARTPFDLEGAAQFLDRPRYRLQRMAFPLLAWAVHPAGGGSGLVTALFAVGVVAVFAGALAAGDLSTRLGGTPLPALLFVLSPGAWFALRFTLSDTLALACALGAVTLSLRGRHRWAVAAAVVAVLTKESLLLIPIGLALSHRDRPRVMLAGIPAMVAGAWWLALHWLVDDNSEGVTEFTYPFGGLIESISLWSDGVGQIAMLTVPTTLLFGGYVLSRVGLGHPLSGALVLQLLFVPFLGMNVLGLDANGTRMVMPLFVLAAVALSGTRTRRSPAATAPTPG